MVRTSNSCCETGCLHVLSKCKALFPWSVDSVFLARSSPYLSSGDSKESLLHDLWATRTFPRNVEKCSDIKESKFETSVQVLRAIVDCVCVMRTLWMVKFRSAINP
ncbi:hypothetical protein AVEN_182910-1 [Araneus ventricosus]|uniref:Uncharacterized protein n=1 Tax=Araneus ventricosus TaxID=182803 RepID=A0A4Y2L7L6_ARAVE|nr:hypothetical protein AVEN_262027-1 [Araneus ventricosus]GBN09823.1 hypothetical protein AVEN_10992-1 [Araneus ventricosus]GBN09844.1 hypothetical protein AVEN_130994-1 [Araneus ventricosus]GBN09857.1 hypothetical protein AVEN_182910-1 [Araneus ventricosus]